MPPPLEDYADFNEMLEVLIYQLGYIASCDEALVVTWQCCHHPCQAECKALTLVEWTAVYKLGALE